jgi:hypothetical protein
MPYTNRNIAIFVSGLDNGVKSWGIAWESYDV